MVTETLTRDQDRIVKKTLSKVSGMATLPAVTTRIIAIVEDPKSKPSDLHEVIRTDPALATKVLKVVNSAFYGLPSQVSSIERAIVLLGLAAVQNIAVASSITKMFRGGKISEQFDADDLWKHCIGVAVAARCLVRSVGETQRSEEAFLAGLIHDLGILIELQAFGESFGAVIGPAMAKEDTFLNCERRALGVDHQLLGSALAAKWNFPPQLVACIAYHHASSEAPTETQRLVSLIETADIFSCQQRFGLAITPASLELTPALLERAGLKQEHIEGLQQSFDQECEAALAILTG